MEMEKMRITFDDSLKLGRENFTEECRYSEFLVEMTPIEDATAYGHLSVVAIVEARSFNEAVINAFFTRNVASSWVITQIEEA